MTGRDDEMHATVAASLVLIWLLTVGACGALLLDAIGAL